MNFLLIFDCSFLVVKKVEEHALFYRRNDSKVDENDLVVVLLFFYVFGILDIQHTIEKNVDIGMEKVRMKDFLIAEEDFGKRRHDF